MLFRPEKVPGPSAPQSWPDEELARLKSLWADGWSGGEIARILGNGRTRCSVLGKVHRLKLEPRRTKIWTQRFEDRPCHVGTRKPRAKKAPKPKKAAPPPKVEIVPVTAASAWEPVAGSTPVLIDDLPRYGMCRWPMGDGVSTHVCGATSGRKTYCPEHTYRAWDKNTIGHEASLAKGEA